jgi:TM2 domain-containing membrane protein YozV
MVATVARMAPVILSVCAVMMFLLGIRRFRMGQPFKGLANMAFAGVIAIMAWSIGKM